MMQQPHMAAAWKAPFRGGGGGGEEGRGVKRKKKKKKSTRPPVTREIGWEEVVWAQAKPWQRFTLMRDFSPPSPRSIRRVKVKRLVLTQCHSEKKGGGG